jgi:hypothetical protein
MSKALIVKTLVIGLAAGVLSGILGIGGGIILVPALVAVAGFTPAKAQGTSLALLSLPVAAVAAYSYWSHDYVDLTALPWLALGFLVGGVLGLGGGIFLVPLLLLLLLLLAGLSQQSAQGTSLALLSLPVAVAAAFTYMRKEQVQLNVLPSMSIGFIAGGVLGASVALYLPGQLLARVFGVALILIGF